MNNGAREILSYLLGCEKSDIDCLRSIKAEAEYFMPYAKETSIKGIGDALTGEVIKDLTIIYHFVCDQFDKEESFNSYLEFRDFDRELVGEALNLLNPRDDVRWGIQSVIYIELDYWDLYANLVDDICKFFNFSGEMMFRNITASYVDDVWGGEECPAQFKPLID